MAREPEAAPVEPTSDGATRRLLATVPAAALAGAVLGLADAARALAASLDIASALALFSVVLFGAIVLDLVAHGLIALLGAAARRWRHLAPSSLWAAAAALAAIPLGRALFSGAGVQRTQLGTLGPWLLPLLAAALVLAGRALCSRLGKAGRITAWAALLAACFAALALDRWFLVGLYDYLHVLAVLFALLGLGLVVQRLVPQRGVLPELGAVLTAVVVLAFVAVSQLFPADNAARTFLVQERPLAERVMRALTFLVDADRDGSSPLFAGGDCHDFDAAIGQHAADVPGNGVDEDCDGTDAAETRARRPYGGSRSAAAELAQRARGRPTVVLIVDALRADRVGRPAYPELDRLAAESLFFEHAYAPASSTSRSVPAMLVGHPLPAASEPSAAEQMRKQGLSTALATVDIVVATITGEIPARGSLHYPLLRGFSRTELVPSGHDGSRSWGGNVTGSSDSQVTDRAFQLLDSAAPPDLLWVHYFDLHQWMMLAAVTTEGYARYDDVLRRVDTELARWRARLDHINLVLVSDHGEALGEHGSPTHTKFLWNSLVRVPLLVRIPGTPPARIATPVTIADLAPTLLELVGLGAAPREGFSLLTLAGSPAATHADFTAYETRQLSLLEGSYRVVFDVETRAAWLYDVVRDPGEQRSLMASEPERAAQMVQRALALKPAHAP
jgi:hypothetical protein